MVFLKVKKICTDKNFLPLLFPDFFQKKKQISLTFTDPLTNSLTSLEWKPCPFGGNSKVKNEDPSGGNTETFFELR